MRLAVVALAALAVLALGAAPALARNRPRAEPDAVVSETLVAGSGPYFGNDIGLDLKLVPEKLYLDLDYFIATDQDHVLHHSVAAGVAWSPRPVLTWRFDGDASPSAGTATRSYWTAGVSSGLELSGDPGSLEASVGARHFAIAESAATASFNQFELAGRARAWFGPTTVSARVSGYLYDEDLSRLGSLRLSKSGGATFGSEGLPTRPQLFDVRLGVRHRWGPWRAGVTTGFTQYIDGQGSLALVSARLSRALGPQLSILGGLSLQVDSPAPLKGRPPDSSTSLLASVGVEIEL